MKVISSCIFILAVAICGVLGVCKVGEYRRDPENCSIFWQCEPLDNWTYQLCPSGLLFNDVLNVCDWPQNVDCKTNRFEEHKARSSNKKFTDNLKAVECRLGDYKADPNNCNKFFQCEPSLTWAHHTCAPGTLYNPKLKVCDWPANVQCNGNGLEDREVRSSIIGFTDNSKSAECRWGEYKADLNNCNKFFQCEPSLTWAHHTCAPGTLFNPKLKVCDWPANVQCASAANNRCSVQVDESKIPINAVGCCDPCENFMSPSHLPDARECSFFYKCNHGIPARIDCPAGLHWSIELDRCDWPEVANCKRPLANKFC